jgi:hypothetical protein
MLAWTFLNPVVLDRFHNLLGGVLGNSLRDADGPPHGGARSRDRISDPEVPDRNSPLDQFGPQDVEQRIHPELIVGREADLCLGTIELDGAVAVLEVVALADFFHGLVDRVVDLLKVGAGRNIKGRVGSHRAIGCEMISVSG